MHGHVGRRVAADDGGRDVGAVLERDGDLLRALDDVLVRHDVALVVEEPAAAGRTAAATLTRRDER